MKKLKQSFANQNLLRSKRPCTKWKSTSLAIGTLLELETKRRVMYRGITYSTSEIQRRYLSIVVNDDFVEKTVNAILESAATDQVGDGKIFILPVEEAYRIRTGEKGGQSLN